MRALPSHFRRLASALACALLAAGCSAPTPPAADVPDAHVAPDAPEDIAVDALAAPDDGPGEPTREWPNAESRANSDPWLAAHHREIRVMRPRVLVLNFVNARTNEQAATDVGRILAAMREGSRYRGYEDARAEPFLQPEIARVVDLRDAPPPPGYTLRNSTAYPRRPDPRGFNWGFDYAQLFNRAFAERYGFDDPARPGTRLDLCGLVDAGLVHEVWIYGDADVPDVSAAEVLAWVPRYDAEGHIVPGDPGDACAGNGCFDRDVPHCARSLRIGWVNNTRGPGCYLESLSHGFESLGKRGVLPYLEPYFREFAGFDLRERFGVDFESWYACPYNDQECVSWTSPSAVRYATTRGSGTLEPYVPACGNAHFPPNGRRQYDVVNQYPALSTCEGYRRRESPDGTDLARPFSAAQFARYRELAPDCTGAWLVWWWQNWPQGRAAVRDDQGNAMLNWYPFLYY